MAEIIVKRRYLIAVPMSLLVLFSIGFSIRLLYAERYVQSASEAIATGKTQLFQKTVSGAMSAYQTFQGAYSGNYATATDEQKIKIRVYLSATRIMDMLLRNDGGSIDTIAELMAQYGVTRTGDAFDTLDIIRPTMNDDEKIILPQTAPPSAETIRAFLAGPFLSTVNASIADMDAAIALCPAAGEGIDREIIAKDLIDATDPYQPDVEIDAGDYYLLRSTLKFMKAYALICAGYNHDIDIREIVALVNLEAGQEMIKRLLDRYPDFLKISDNVKLNEARLTLIDAVTDYETASAKIRGDNDTQAGAEELFSLEDDYDYYDESLYRENLAKAKTSLQNNTPILLTEERFGTVYSVYGGNSFTTNEISWWEKGLFPEQYGYTYLGESSASATFSGQYAYYIITTRTGNIAAVDSVQCSDATLSLHADGNAPNWSNINNGAPDGSYALLGGGGIGQGDFGEGAFIVIQPSAPINLLTVNLTNIPADSPLRLQLGEDRLNFFPFFGNGTNAKALRDMLPQLNEYGYPVPGTMGHGLGDSPTLGGILPDYTQEQWTREWPYQFQPSGPVTITERAIEVQDGVISDWSGINPVFIDITGESDPAGDIQSLYLAKDTAYLYLRIDTAGTIPTTNIYGWMSYYVDLKKLPGDQHKMPNDIRILVYYDWYFSQWRAQLSADSIGYSLNSTDLMVFGNHVELKVSLAQLGTISGRFLVVGSENSWNNGDDNFTSLQTQPVASIAGNLTVPGYDGIGPVRIGVFEYGPDFSTDPQKRLGSQLVYPDGSGNLPATFIVNNLPVGQKVFVTVFWDRDCNGIVSPGDYTNFYQPLITIDGNNVQNLAVNDDHPDYPPPEFSMASVYNEKNSAGYWNVLIAASLTGPSPEDVTLTVSGQDVEYTLTPGAWIGNRFGLIYKINVPWLPNGDYTFTAVDSLGRRAEKTCHYEARYDLPGITSLTPVSGFYTGTTTPTLSWTPPATGGPYTYEVWVLDYTNPNNVVRYVSDLTSINSFTVPAGVLLPNAPYYWFVRLYDSADNPTSVTNSPVNVFYTGAYATTPAYSSIWFGLMPPTGSITNYMISLDVKLPGVAPWDVTAWRIKKGGSLIFSGGTPSFFNRSDDAWLSIFFQTPTPPISGNDYQLQMDINRSGTISTLSQTGIFNVSQSVEAVDITSLTPTGNYYFKTTTPTFSWNDVTDPGTLNRLRIYDPLGRIPLYSGPWSATPSAAVPAGVLKPGGTYLWTVMTLKDNVYAYVNSEGNTSTRTLLRFTIQAPLKGDVSGNGEIGLDDAVLALQVAAGLGPVVLSTGDVNADGRVGLQEAIYVIQSLSGLR